MIIHNNDYAWHLLLNSNSVTIQNKTNSDLPTLEIFFEYHLCDANGGGGGGVHISYVVLG